MALTSYLNNNDSEDEDEPNSQSVKPEVLHKEPPPRWLGA